MAAAEETAELSSSIRAGTNFAEEKQAVAVCVAVVEKAAEVAQPGQISLRRRLKEKQRKKEHRVNTPANAWANA